MKRVVELVDLEAGAGDQRAHVAGQVAAAGEALLPRIEAVLEPRDLRVGREAVLGEVERGARLQHAAHLGERGVDVGDRAQRHRRERGVEAVVGKVEPRAVERTGVHRARVDAAIRACASFSATADGSTIQTPVTSAG